MTVQKNWKEIQVDMEPKVTIFSGKYFEKWSKNMTKNKEGNITVEEAHRISYKNSIINSANQILKEKTFQAGKP